MFCTVSFSSLNSLLMNTQHPSFLCLKRHLSLCISMAALLMTGFLCLLRTNCFKKNSCQKDVRVSESLQVQVFPKNKRCGLAVKKNGIDAINELNEGRRDCLLFVICFLKVVCLLLTIICSFASRGEPAQTVQRPDEGLQPPGKTGGQRLRKPRRSVWLESHADHRRGT